MTAAMANQQRVIVCLGMHRSGTSAVTRALAALGVELGDNLLGASPTENPMGYWEDKDLLAIAERVLGALDTSWSALGVAGRESAVWGANGVEGLVDEAADLIKARFAGADPWGFKNPRTARLLPFWWRVMERVGAAPSYVITVRNPLSVFKSLERRNRFSLQHACLLWLEHVVPAFNQLRDAPRLVVDFDILLNDPGPQLDRMATALGLPEASAEARRGFEEKFLDIGLRHFRYGLEELAAEPGISPFVIEAYRGLLRVARDELPVDDPELAETFRRLQSELEQNQAVYHRLGDLEHRLPALNALLQQREVALEEIRRAFTTELSGSRARMHRELETLDEEARQRQAEAEHDLAAVNADLETAKVRGRELQEVLASAKEEVARLREEAEQLAETRRALAAAERALEQTENRLTDRESELSEVSQERAHAQEQLTEQQKRQRILDGELSRLRAVHDDLDAERHEARAELSRAERERRAAVERGAAWNDELHGERERRLQLEAELNRLSHRVVAASLKAAQATGPFYRLLLLVTWPLRASLSLLFRLRRNGLRAELANLKTMWLLKRSGIFDARFYLERYPDVAAAGISPFRHFIRFGIHENRSPGPTFSPQEYLLANPDIQSAGLNPTVHYVRHGRHEHRVLSPQALEHETDWSAVRFVKERAIDLRRPVTVIVPVYVANDVALVALRALLDSFVGSYPRERDGRRFLFIDDRSPLDDCRELLGGHRFTARDDCTVLENPENIGFVRTVNAGFRAAASDADVLILNCDTEIHGRPIEILQDVCYRHDRIASATPMSNRADLSSLQNWPTGSDGILGLEPAEVVDAIEAFGLQTPEEDVPTGHGFCMYMSRAALDEVGVFDEKRFGAGYGEENDWSRRAAQLGYRHLICTETFVFHRESLSFAGKEKEELKKRNLQVLLKKHPDYIRDVRTYSGRDPLQAYRALLMLAVSAKIKERDRLEHICFMLHDDLDSHIGGTQQHVKQVVSGLMKRGSHEVLLVAPEKIGGRHWMLSFHQPSFSLKITGIPEDALRCLLEQLAGRIDLLHVHHTMGWSKQTLNFVRSLDVRRKIATIHDYFFFCRSPFLLKDDKRLCERRNEQAACDECSVDADVDYWRRRGDFLRLLEGFDRVFVPSNSCKALFTEMSAGRSSVADKLEVLEHPLVYADKVATQRLFSRPPLPSPFKVVVFLGALAPHKGERLFADAVHSLEGDGYFCQVWGGGERSIDACPTRSYANWKELFHLGRETPPRIVVMPSLCPETYSYTLYEALCVLRTPVVVGPHGNPAAMISATGAGRVMAQSNPTALVEAIREIEEDYETVCKRVERARVEMLRDKTLGRYVEAYLSAVQSKRAEQQPELVGVAKPRAEVALATTPPTATERAAFEESQRILWRHDYIEKLRPLRILMVSGLHGAPNMYRVENAAEQVRGSGCEVETINVARAGDIRSTKEFDLLFLHRVATAASNGGLLDRAREDGTPIVLDSDDLVFHHSFDRELYFLEDLDDDDKDEYAAVLRGLERTFGACDAMLASTPMIAESAWRLGKPAIVHRNVLSNRQLSILDGFAASRRLRMPGGEVIGYFSGSKSHDADFASIEEPLLAFLRRMSQIKLLVMGHLDETQIEREMPERVIRMGYDNLEAYYEAMASCAVTLAPLAKLNSFSHAKSGLKFFESGALGVPVIATPIGEMEYFVEHGRNGWLAEDASDWERALEHAFTGGNHDRVGERAKEKVASRCTVQAYAHRLHLVLQAVCDHVNAK